MTDTAPAEIEIDDATPTSAELMAIAARLTAAGQRRSLEPVGHPDEAAVRAQETNLLKGCGAKVREVAGYRARRDIAAEDGDIAHVDHLTERIGAVLDGMSQTERATVEAAADHDTGTGPFRPPTLNTEPADTDDDGEGFSVHHPGLGHVVIGEATHATLDTLIEECGLLEVDEDDGDPVYAAAAAHADDLAAVFKLNSDDKRAFVEAALVERAQRFGV